MDTTRQTGRGPGDRGTAGGRSRSGPEAARASGRAVARRLGPLLAVLLVAAGACRGSEGEGARSGGVGGEWAELREAMVQRQIVDRGVTEPRVVRAMRTVPRHEFVPDAAPSAAYGDGPLPIGHGQTISQPYIVAFMAEAADLDAGDRVLEIGTGSGYGAAVLGELAGQVYTIEIVPALAERARRSLERAGYRNVHVRAGNGWLGWAEHAPYDAVVVTAAPDKIPEALVEQLAVGGKLVIPVGDRVQVLQVLRKTPDRLILEASLPVQFVPMVGEPPDTGS